MSSIFSKIIEGLIPSHRVYEDAATYAFLDINPRQPGHTLVVPKLEVDYLFDLPTDDYTALWKTVNTVAEGLKKVTGCARVVVIVLGYEVPHAHIHLIPSNNLSDIPFPPVDETAQAGLVETAEQVRAALDPGSGIER
ncbi:MAG: HIT family protein [Acidimicrobiia bacterium]